MKSGSETDIEFAEQILELIAHIERRLADRSRAAFLGDRDERDLTAFRLAAIGEMANKLTPELKARQAQIDWRAIYAMRNLIFHHYAGIDADRVWQAAQTGLAELRQACMVELDSLDS